MTDLQLGKTKQSKCQFQLQEIAEKTQPFVPLCVTLLRTNGVRHDLPVPEMGPSASDRDALAALARRNNIKQVSWDVCIVVHPLGRAILDLIPESPPPDSLVRLHRAQLGVGNFTTRAPGETAASNWTGRTWRC